MAPTAPLGREGARKLVAAGRFPIAFGSPHPCVMILQQDGVYRIRELVIDAAEARAASAAAIAKSESWMPEHSEAPTPDELLAQMKTMEWPASW